MRSHALQITSDGADGFRWMLLEPASDALHFAPRSHSDCVFDSYEAALHAGTLALADADEQAFENEAADPVGDADRAVADVPPT